MELSFFYQNLYNLIKEESSVPKITDIKNQVNNKNRFSIYVDGQFSFGISLYLLKKHKLDTGQTIDESKMRVIALEDSYEKAKEYVLTYLSSKSEKEIIDKLKRKGYEEDTVTRTLHFLKEYQYIDDTAYAKKIIHDSLHVNKQGPNKIREKLMKKGINQTTIDDLLTNIPFETLLEKANYHKEKKYDHYKRKSANDYELNNKLKRHLLAKGFNWDVINAAFESN